MSPMLCIAFHKFPEKDMLLAKTRATGDVWETWSGKYMNTAALLQHWNSPAEKCDCFEVRIPPQIGSKPSSGSWHTPVSFWPKLTMQACRKCNSSVTWAAKTEKTFKKLWIIFSHCQFCILKNAKFSVTQNLESVDNEIWRMQKISWHGKCRICQSHILTYWHIMDFKFGWNWPTFGYIVY